MLPNPKWFIPAVIVFTLLFYMIVCQICHAEEWSDKQIVNAIYLAEGGSRAEYPYGIRSVSCSTREECSKICFNTVRNNRKRFAKYGYKSHTDFISFLASRYCPTSGRNLSKAEIKLNKNWIKNVRYFLSKEK